MKSKKLQQLLIPLLVFTTFSVLNFPIARSDTLSNGAIYTWSETSYSINTLEMWYDESIEYAYKGDDQYTQTNTYVYHNWTMKEGQPYTYMVEDYIGEYRYIYDNYQNLTFSANFSSMLNLNVYQVEVTYDSDKDGIDDIKLLWMAVKDASWDLEMWMLDQTGSYSSNYKSWNNCTSIRTEYYYENDSQVSPPIIVDYPGEWYNNSYSSSYSGIMTSMEGDPLYLQEIISLNFSMPVILTMQVYKTQSNDYVAWADMFYNFFIFNDTDSDGIFSAGETNNPGQIAMLMSGNSELRGWMMPALVEEYVEMKYYFKENDSVYNHPYAQKINMRFPQDKTIEEMASTIEFTPPTSSDEKISWDIKYPEYPIYGLVMGDMGYEYLPYKNMANPNETINYAQSSPGNFTFGFDCNLGESKSDLDFSIALPRITNDTLFDAVQGLGLSLPHYTYFMASDDIAHTTESALSKPLDLFNFEIGGAKVAEINMLNPAKKNYTLFDYPTTGTNSEFESKGATVSRIAMSSGDNKLSPLIGGDPFSVMIFDLETFVEDNPAFTNFKSYYSIETQNYPTWSGYQLTHDPTFTAYYSSSSGTAQQAINGYVFIPLFAVSTMTITILIRKIYKKKQLEKMN